MMAPDVSRVGHVLTVAKRRLGTVGQIVVCATAGAAVGLALNRSHPARAIGWALPHVFKLMFRMPPSEARTRDAQPLQFWP